MTKNRITSSQYFYWAIAYFAVKLLISYFYYIFALFTIYGNFTVLKLTRAISPYIVLLELLSMIVLSTSASQSH